MEHLPQLLKPTKPFAEVPFLRSDQFTYDGKGISGFPERCGFTFTGFDPHCKDREASACFQSWLFFGTLIEVFGAYNIPILQEDFVRVTTDDREVITTVHLQDYIAAWIVRVSDIDFNCLEKDRVQARPNSGKKSVVRGHAIASTVVAAELVLRRRCSISEAIHIQRQSHGEFKQWLECGEEIIEEEVRRIRDVFQMIARELREHGSRFQAVEDSIWDSVLILCTTLLNAASAIYRYHRWDFKSEILLNEIQSRTIPRLFNENQWCPREKKIIRDLVNGDHCALYLCAHLDRPQDQRIHHNCTATMCYAYQLDSSKYRTRHVNEACNCAFIGLGEAYAEDLRLQARKETYKLRPAAVITYQQGSVNVVNVSLLGAEVSRLSHSKVMSQQHFVAISHVWADGLGNPHSNTLPICQLARLQVSQVLRYSHFVTQAIGFY